MEHRPHIYDASTRARFALTYRLQTMMPEGNKGAKTTQEQCGNEPYLWCLLWARAHFWSRWSCCRIERQQEQQRWVVKGADLGPASELPHQSSILSKSPYRLPGLGSERAKYTCMLTVDWWW